MITSLMEFLSERKYARLLLLSLSLVFLGLIIAGEKRFTVWGQIADAYFYSGLEPIGEGLHRDNLADYPALNRFVHLPRKWLMLPVVLVSHYFEIDAHLVFSWVSWVLLLATSLLLEGVVQVPPRKLRFYMGPVIYLLLCLCSLAMSGRMLFGYFSVSLLIWLHWASLRHEGLPAPAELLLSFLILWTSSVTTGVFGVVYLCWLGWVLFLRPRHSSRGWQSIGTCLLALTGGGWLVAGSLKNFLFFGGSAFDIGSFLSHGYGWILLKGWLIFIPLAFALLLWRYRRRLLSALPEPPIVLLMVLSIGLGTVDYVTITLWIPLLILLGSRLVVRYFEYSDRIDGGITTRKV